LQRLGAYWILVAHGDAADQHGWRAFIRADVKAITQRDSAAL
jgi:hypothetical protein